MAGSPKRALKTGRGDSRTTGEKHETVGVEKIASLV